MTSRYVTETESFPDTPLVSTSNSLAPNFPVGPSTFYHEINKVIYIFTGKTKDFQLTVINLEYLYFFLGAI